MNKMKLKIYNYKKNKKYKLHKSTKFVALLLAPIMIASTFSACSRKEDDNYNPYSDYTYYDNHYKDEPTEISIDVPVEETQPISTEKVYTNTEYSKYYNMKLNLSYSDFSDLNVLIDNISVKYPLNESFYIDKAYNLYKKSNIYVSNSSNIFSDRKISANKIFDIVKKNNVGASKNAYISDSDLMYVCEVMSDVINDFVATNNDVDLNNLSQKIINLKIKTFDEFSNGYYDQNISTLGISTKALRGDKDFCKKTIEHETYHLLSFNSIEEASNSNYSSKSGISYRFPNLSVNSLSWEWFNEASAEYLTMDRNNTFDSKVYSELVNSADTIKVATILNKNNDVESFEKLAYAKSLEDLFKYFNVKTEEEKEAVLNLMFAFNIILDINYTSSSREFYKEYRKEHGKDMTSEEKREFIKELKGGISTTLTKCFYRNLIEQISNKEVSLDQIFSLISVYENEISRFTWYHENIYEMKDFIMAYNFIQTSFFEIIANKLNIKTYEVQNAYNSFDKYEVVNTSYIKLLDNKKQTYLQYIVDTRKNHRLGSINTASNGLTYNGRSR